MAKKKILIVDDDAAITKLLKMMIEKDGRYEIYTENDPNHVLETIRSASPDLLILDVNMPGLGGGDIVAELRQNDIDDLPIIFLTGSVSQEESDAGMRISGYPAMSKPVDLAKLLNLIASVTS